MSRLVARFWNSDGVEMPALYYSDGHGLICTWNYLMLVAPDLEGENARLRQVERAARTYLAAMNTLALRPSDEEVAVEARLSHRALTEALT